MSEKGELVELRDGSRALIRPIGPEDRDRLREGFEGASPESIYLRFLAPVPRLSSKTLTYLTAIDHDHHEALIAVDPDSGQSFGTARYVRSDDDPRTAEFAVGVGDQWMRLGLGTALLTALVSCARAAGVVRFTGTINAENAAIKRLVDRGARVLRDQSVGFGAQEISVDLGPAPSVASSEDRR